MTLSTTLLLGFIAGVTILLGLPVGRMHKLAPSTRLLLNAIAVGVLVFLVWDVLSGAWEPIDAALASVHQGHGGLGTAIGYGLLFIAGIAVGLLSLVWYERWMARKVAAKPAGTPGRPQGPGAMTIGEVRPPRGLASWSSAKRLSLLIAVGIGLHNATEGFGIVAPLAADVDEDGRSRTPSWRFLLALGLIGGGPTFVGTVIGHGFASEALSVVFLTLAAGSILYVITQLVGVAARAKRSDLLAYGIVLGLLAGFLTDAIVTAAGV
jgi:ZIP family zinc transporter